MKAMVFPAGLGQRLQPLTDRLPKALVCVGGRPMIDYPLLLLRHYGVRDVVINLHHQGEQIESYLGDGGRLGLRIAYSHEKELLDTGGGLLKAKAFLRDAPFIVINTDVLIDLPLAELIAFHEEKRAMATLALRVDPRADQFGSLEIEPDGRVYRFLEARRAPATSGPTTKLMFTGVQIFDPRVFDYMPNDGALQKFGTTKHTYPRMVREGERLFGFRFDGFWQDLGTPERIRDAEQSLASGHARLHYLPPGG